MNDFFAAHFKQPVTVSNLTQDDRGIYFVQLLNDKRSVVVKPVRPKEAEIHSHVFCADDDSDEMDVTEEDLFEYGTMFNATASTGVTPKSILGVEETICLPKGVTAVVFEEDLTKYVAVRKICNKITHSEPWFPSGLSEDPTESDLWYNQDDDLLDLVLGMLEKDPRRRMSCEEVLSHPWMQ